MSADITYIYGLVDPRDGRIRYIGKADNPVYRYRKHCERLRGHTHKVNWIRALLNLGLKPVLVFLEQTNRYCWQEAEQFQIAFFRERGFDLTNSTNGGDGRVGYTMTLGARQKLSEYWTGRKRPPETFEKISVALMGHKVSIEARQRQSEAQKKRFLTESSPNKGRKASDETRRKIREARRNQIITPKHKLAISMAAKRKREKFH